MSEIPATVIALIVVGIMILIMRWVFAPSRPRWKQARTVDASEAPDLGLLTVVASGLSRHDALVQRARLGDAGIRSSMSTRRDGTMDVLVFNADVDSARAALDL